MKQGELPTNINMLIKSEKDIKQKCLGMMNETSDAEAAALLRAVIKSKDECIFNLYKILESLE